MILSPAKATRYDEAILDDLHTGEWWSRMQREIVGDDNSVILPLMLSSDATLVTGNGNSKAWPMYLSLGNVPKKYRFLKAYRACRVLAYLPIITIRADCANKPWISLCKAAIFQQCMKIILKPFANATPAEQRPKPMYFCGPFGNVYSCVPLLATYSADYPEQCLLTATKSWRNGYGCPRCLVQAKDYKHGLKCTKRNNANMKEYQKSCKFGCFPIENAFWETDFDIYDALVIDDLHQLGGLYRHLIQFVERIIKKDRGKVTKVEQRCQQLPVYSGMKKFKKGFLLSNLTNPSFDEFRKHMRLVICLVYDLLPLQCTLCLRAFIDFFIQICSKEHTSSTLDAADEYLRLFFLYLPAFQDCSNMLMPKLHMMTKYTDDIKMKGPLDSYSTMHSERLHIYNAKQPSKRTNHRDTVSFNKQLARFIEDRDVLYDIYEPALPTNSSASNTCHRPSFILTSVKKEQEYQHVDSLEKRDSRLRGLHQHLVLYLDSLTRGSRRRISLANCMPLGSLTITTYGQLQVTETNDDLSKNSTWIRAGFFYNNQYNDCIKAVDVTMPKRSSKYQDFYGKVLAFVEVLYGDGKKYRLCVGQLFEENVVAHPTGYKSLLMVPSMPKIFVCCVEHVLEKVHIVPDFGNTSENAFLLNHDVSQHSWANATPLLCSLDSYTGWKTNDDEADISDEESESEHQEVDSDDGNDSDGSDEDNLADFVQF